MTRIDTGTILDSNTGDSRGALLLGDTATRKAVLYLQIPGVLPHRLPLVTPGMVTTAILCLGFSWNDYAFAATFAGPSGQTLPIAAAQLNTQTGLNRGQLSAIGTIVVLPMIIVGLAVRRNPVRGLTLGAVTGE